MANKRERRELNKHWLRKWLTGKPHFIIGGTENPYLLRWFVIPRNPWFNVYLHKFLRSDDDRALHDHPWWFVSLILKGAYWEHRSEGFVTGKKLRKAGSLAIRRPSTLHRVELEGEAVEVFKGYGGTPVYGWREKPTWTLIATGPKIRDWGFLCPKGWVQWETFDHNNGCGEYA